MLRRFIYDMSYSPPRHFPPFLFPPLLHPPSLSASSARLSKPKTLAHFSSLLCSSFVAVTSDRPGHLIPRFHGFAQISCASELVKPGEVAKFARSKRGRGRKRRLPGETRSSTMITKARPENRGRSMMRVHAAGQPLAALQFSLASMPSLPRNSVRLDDPV